ncbi:MAG TPA: glycosyltransferase [Alphaproteobacteria bacterium]|nr:glycosyltransferase [Alphaproteobacteria bacterium]
MKKILFLRRDGVYLPEISAYMAYLRKKMPLFEICDSSEIKENFSESDFDVIWKFMGFDRQNHHGRFVVHEYGSLSVGRLPRVKNVIKRVLNSNPSMRVFLNEAVRQGMGFNGNTDYRLRDMGVSSHFFRKFSNPDPEFDFVYSGSLNRGRIISLMLDHFKTTMKGSRLLVVGAVPDDIHEMFGKTPNIHFTGRLKYEDVPDAITQARYGLNIMPDIYPFNIQTSTKVLEYCAARMPVISTNYKWISEFEREAKGKFFYIENSFSNLKIDDINKYPFVVPSMEDYEWDKIIEKSKVFDFLG